MNPGEVPRFIVDLNAGQHTGWLRLIGYDAVLFDTGMTNI
jgi:uncharacterized protein with PIN domain